MIRVGIHYLEPRRLGFFVAEEAAVWVAFVAAATWVAQGFGLPPTGARLLVEAALVGAVIEFALSLADLHHLRVAVDDLAQGRRLLRVLGAVALLMAAFAAAFLRPADTAPLAAGTFAASLSLLASRGALAQLGRRGSLHTRVYLVGQGRTARRLREEIARDGVAEVVGTASPGVRDLVDRARRSRASVVVYAVDDRRGLPTDELLRCRLAGIPVADAALFSGRVLHRLPVELVRPGDLIYGDGFQLPALQRLGRRTLSTSVAVLLLALASPVLALAVLAIKLDSRGPVLFRQERVGLGGQVFNMFKLRTMTVNAERDGVVWARADDPRVTRVGRWLRRFRIDELPQLANVLRGEMELVGPRPERPEFVRMLRLNIPFYDVRHLVAPGITGWAQVCYPYAASVEEAREKLQYDLYYVRHVGVLFDLFILLLTARTILLGRGAR